MKTFDWGEFLRHDSFVSTQDDTTRQWLVTDEVSSEHTYEPGAVIIREGEIGDSIFVIGSGSAEALLSVDGAPEILLAIMRRGETFGEMGVFERRPRSATVRARERCVVLEVRGEALRGLADAHPEIGFRLLLQVGERLRAKNEHILTLHLKSVEAANRAKDEFVAMLGHELRNPLGAIATAIHVLDARADPHDASAPLRGIIVRQTRHLARLVEDLLDVSKLVSGKIVLTTQPDYLRDVVMRAVASFHEAGKASQHVISVTGTGVRVQADATRLQQVARRRLPEIALIDLGLPGMDGYAVARALRSAPGGEGLLLIAITGYGRATDRRRAQEAGFDAHLTKPVSPPELAALLLSKR